MSRPQLPWMGARLRSLSSIRAVEKLIGLAALVAVATFSGCYQGEWRLGVEVPVATTNRLVPVRDVERWELASTTVPNVVQVKASISQRCRYALYGTTRRTDVGHFKRVGGGWWTALAIATGTAGGAAGGFGVGGWMSNLYPEWGRYAMYGAGGAVAATGLATCIATLARPTRVRLALCGIFVGLGGAVLGGAAISGLPSATSTSATPNTSGFTPLIDTTTFRTLALAGAGLIGASIFTGIIGGTWRDHIERERVVENESMQTWDPQTSEQACGAARPLSGRVAALEVTSEYLTDGLGSDASPLKLRVALGGQSQQSVDLRPLRAALPSCGALRVQLVPDIVYETFSDDYIPPVPPDQMLPSGRPIHGLIGPRDGIWLSARNTERHIQNNKPTIIAGISPEVLAAVEQRCRGDQPPAESVDEPRRPSARPQAARRPPPPEQSAPEPEAPVATPAAPQTPVSAADRPSAPSANSEGSFAATPGLGLTPQRRPLAGSDSDAECSADSQQARFADCEHQCGRALELSACLFAFRKCHINARGTALPQKERESCDLAWEQCLFNANVAPGSWRRCVDGCVQANEPGSCKSKN